MECPHCGSTMAEGEKRCQECQRPLLGDPRNAPEGSDTELPDHPSRTPSNLAVWGLLATVLVLAAVLAVMSL